MSARSGAWGRCVGIAGRKGGLVTRLFIKCILFASFVNQNFPYIKLHRSQLKRKAWFPLIITVEILCISPASARCLARSINSELARVERHRSQQHRKLNVSGDCCSTLAFARGSAQLKFSSR